MSVSISLRKLVKRYGENVAIPDLSLDISNGEFFTLLGPSGCGKTTLLRMIAGFNSVEGGDITFNDKSVVAMPPQHRNIGMVFQDYAIFPHMTVESNVAFGLTNRKVRKQEVARRVASVLESVHIAELAGRLPGEMSGGQQQRVALARAIVIGPDVLLMDEPLSNLDAKLRVEMRDTIREIQHDAGITTVYVTHDQEEAMAVSDRIAVMNAGRIEHAGTPANIYHRPATVFVANFIGKTNLMKRTLRGESQEFLIDLVPGYSVRVGGLIDSQLVKSRDVVVAIRPESFRIAELGESGIAARITGTTFLGATVHHRVMIESGEEIEFIAPSELSHKYLAGDPITLRISPDQLNIFDVSSEASITREVSNDAARN